MFANEMKPEKCVSFLLCASFHFVNQLFNRSFNDRLLLIFDILFYLPFALKIKPRILFRSVALLLSKRFGSFFFYRNHRIQFICYRTRNIFKKPTIKYLRCLQIILLLSNVFDVCEVNRIAIFRNELKELTGSNKLFFSFVNSFPLRLPIVGPKLCTCAAMAVFMGGKRVLILM